MAADGVDLLDEEAAARWIDAFNNRPFEERDALLGPVLDHGAVELPLRALPRDDAIAASAAAAPILQKFDVLTEFFPTERPLTERGNLRLADAKSLVELLDTGDLVDERVGDKVYKTRSVANLPGLQLLIAWAKAAGVVRIQRGRMIAVKRWAQVRRDPVAAQRRAVRALLEIGPLGGRFKTAPFWDEIDFFDDGAVHFLAAVWCSEDEPTPFDAVVEQATQTYEMRFQWPEGYPEALISRTADRYLSRIFESWELAGVSVRSDAEEFEEYGQRRLRGGALQLTPAGVSIARELLASEGYLAPTAGSFRDNSAAELLGAIHALGQDRVLAELAVWVADRDDDVAAAELAAAVLQIDNPDAIRVAFAALGSIGSPAEAAVRELLETRFRGQAIALLIAIGLDPGVGSSGEPAEGLDLLSALLAAGGPEAVAGSFTEWPTETQVALLDDLRRLDADAVGPVLDAVGRHHPDRTVAKAARKAAMQWRSSARA